MPGVSSRPDYFRAPPIAAVNNTVDEDVINDKVTRIIYSMSVAGQLDFNNTNTSAVDTATPARVELAKTLAIASATLLKNDDNFLPLDETTLTKIAIIGNASSAGAIFGGSGSGAVTAKHSVTILEAIQERFENVVFDDGEDYDNAATAAASADVAIVVIADTSAEGADRVSLELIQSDLVDAIAQSQPNTIVVAISPGPFLTPWRFVVKSIIDVGLPGEQEGNAVAAILFGDVSPSGKLPHTLPNKWNETKFGVNQYPGLPPDDPSNACTKIDPRTQGKDNVPLDPPPCSPTTASYDEELLIGYRYYDAYNIKPAYPFGHGLTYR